MTAASQGTPMLVEGDFNVTFQVKDRPNNARGQDPNSKDFWTFILKATQQELG